MTNWTARTLDENDLSTLESLWHASANRSLVQRPAYALHAARNRQARFAGAWRGDRIEMAIAFCEARRKGLLFWQSPYFAPSCGPLVRAESSTLDGAEAERFWRDGLEAIARAIPASVDRVDAIFPACVTDARGLMWHGWNVRPHYNYLTAWETPGAWESDFGSSVKRQARKARKEGLKCHTLSASETGAIARLWKTNAKRQGLDATLAASIESLGPWLKSEDAGFIVEVRNGDGDVHAAGLFGHDAHRVYYLAGASDPEQLGSGAPTLLHYGALEETDRQGLPQLYDWVGANTPSIARFKRHFGPQLEMTLAATRISRKAGLFDAARRIIS